MMLRRIVDPCYNTFWAWNEHCWVPTTSSSRAHNKTQSVYEQHQTHLEQYKRHGPQGQLSDTAITLGLVTYLFHFPIPSSATLFWCKRSSDMMQKGTCMMVATTVVSWLIFAT
jgi:hypothetical protein